MANSKVNPSARPPCGTLPVTYQKKPSEAVKIVKGSVGAVELHGFSERIGSIEHELEASGELGQPPDVGGRTSDTGEPDHRGLEDAVEGHIL